MRTPLRLDLLGGFRLTDALGVPVVLPLRKAEALLAYLALSPGRMATRDRLAGLLWGEFEQHKARQSLRQALLSIDRALSSCDALVLRTDARTVTLDPAALRLDTEAFETLVAAGDAESLKAAVALYRGDFLDGHFVSSLEFEEWVGGRRAALREAAVATLSRLGEIGEATGDRDAAVAATARALEIDPLREDLHLRLMRLYAAGGMRASAMAQFKACRDILQAELGIEPDTRTLALFRSIASGSADAAAAENPVETAHPDEGPVPATAKTEAEGFPLADLGPLLDDRGPAGACLIVDGPRGAGRSHALAVAAALCRDRGVPAAQVRADGWSRDRPLAFLGDLHRALAAASPAGTHADPLPTAPEEAAAAFADLLARFADGPAALLLDDLHHADTASLDVLPRALRAIRTRPVRIVATVGPGRPGPALCRFLLELTRLLPTRRRQTPPLASDRMEAWLRGLGRWPDDPETAARILAGAAGRPGIALGLLDGSLEEELRLRVQTLEPEPRRILEAAAVIGTGADTAMLARLAGIDDGRCAEALDRLADAALIRFEGELAVPDPAALRDIVLNGLTPPRRKVLEEAAAWFLEERSAGGDPGVAIRAAGHWRAAGDIARARSLALTAGFQAVGRGWRETAREAFRRVRELASAAGPDAADQLPTALLQLAALATQDGDLERAEAWLTDCATAGARLKDGSLAARLASAIALERSRVRQLAGDHEGAVAAVAGALAAAGPVDAWTPVERILLRPHLLPGGSAGAMAALDGARVRGDLLAQALLGAGLATIDGARGSADGAAAHTAEAVHAAEGSGSDRALAVALQARALTEGWRGDWRAADRTLDGALDAAEHGGDLLRRHVLTGFAGWVRLGLEDAPEAALLLDEALELGSRLGATAFMPLFHAWRAEALAETAAGADAAQAAITLAARLNQPWPRTVALRAWARSQLFAERRDLDRAHAAALTALGEQQALGLTVEYAQTTMLLGRIRRAQSRRADAASRFRQAADAFRRLGMQGDHERATRLVDAIDPA